MIRRQVVPGQARQHGVRPADRERDVDRAAGGRRQLDQLAAQPRARSHLHQP